MSPRARTPRDVDGRVPFGGRARRSRVPTTVLETDLCRRFGLTRMEASIAAALAAGLSYVEIAERSVISYDTVHTHAKAIHEKLGVHSTARLAALIYSGRSGEEK